MKETAAQAVSEFIRSPDLFQFDLFESPTITQLKGDSQYGHLYHLLEIILNGNLQAGIFAMMHMSTECELVACDPSEQHWVAS